MQIRLLIPVIALALCAPAAAQSCSDLTVTGDGTPGSTLTFDLAGGAANSPAVLLIGPNAGEFVINFGPLGSLTLGLTPPFVPVLMGRTDGDGGASVSFDVPGADLPQTDLNAQATTIDFTIGAPPSLDFCTSDVEPFSIGGGS